MADAFKERIALLQKGAAQGKLRPEHRAELDRYIAQGVVKPPLGGIPGARVKPTGPDLAAMNAASAAAQSERDAQRMYAGAAKAVDDMGTGSTRAAVLDAMTASPDGGFWDNVGDAIGTLVRPWFGDKVLAARDQLNTVNNQVALAGSQRMKGSSSDKDTALMRLSGVGPYKSVAENHRIIHQAGIDSDIAQLRAQYKAGWIAKYGSLGNPAENGTTFEQGQAAAEQQQANARRLRAAPPSTRRRGSASSPITIDLNGNPIQ